LAGNGTASYLFLSLLQARVGRSLVSSLVGSEPEAVLDADPVELAVRAGLGEGVAREIARLRDEFDPGEIRGRLEENGAGVITPADEEYPERLKRIPDPPPALFVAGGLPRGRPIALVGSRKASPTGIETARALGRALGERGVCVVSGLALGIDAAAHEGALHGGGPTVGVLGCGVDVVYPRANLELFGRVRNGGALVSEYYLGEAPLAWRFPARNRIIAGLCDQVVVVEAGEKSGALITARHAMESGRDVWAVPGPPGAPECRGSNRLLADGAGVLWDVREFVEAVAPDDTRGSNGVLEAGTPPVPQVLPEAEAAVLSGVGFDPTLADAVAARCGVEMGRVLSALALLELKGYVTRDRDGAYARRTVP
jgi:DNA processing protein